MFPVGQFAEILELNKCSFLSLDQDVLDPALLRPGRFDLTIDVPHPNKKGRKEILQHYFDKVKHEKTIDVEKLASISSGLNGSQLENIVNQAAIRAVRQKHTTVDTRLIYLKIVCYI